MDISFHPLVWRWFKQSFDGPTPPQERAGRRLRVEDRRSLQPRRARGKTLAAFLWSIDRLFQRAVSGQLDDTTSVVYVSPLKALGNDIAKNLKQPLAEIFQLAWSEGILVPEIRVAVRSGDTPASERQSMVEPRPHSDYHSGVALYFAYGGA